MQNTEILPGTNVIDGVDSRSVVHGSLGAVGIADHIEATMTQVRGKNGTDSAKVPETKKKNSSQINIELCPEKVIVPGSMNEQGIKKRIY